MAIQYPFRFDLLDHALTAKSVANGFSERAARAQAPPSTALDIAGGVYKSLNSNCCCDGAGSERKPFVHRQ